MLRHSINRFLLVASVMILALAAHAQESCEPGGSCGGNQSQGFKYAGGDLIDNVAWYSGNDSWVLRGSGAYGTHAVATRMCNELMLFDMSGNVHEWCQDWYGGYSSESQVNPAGAVLGTERVYRGGSWYFDEWFCRVSFRNGVAPGYMSYGIGLRLAL